MTEVGSSNPTFESLTMKHHLTTPPSPYFSILAYFACSATSSKNRIWTLPLENLEPVDIRWSVIVGALSVTDSVILGTQNLQASCVMT